MPTKVEIYPTKVSHDFATSIVTHVIQNCPSQKYNDPFQKMMMNVFHFSKNSPDFSIYDISPCFEPDQQMHLMASEQNTDIRDNYFIGF